MKAHLSGKWIGTYEVFNYTPDTTDNSENLAQLLNGETDSTSNFSRKQKWKPNNVIEKIALDITIDSINNINSIFIIAENKTRTYELEFLHFLVDHDPNEFYLLIGKNELTRIYTYHLNKPKDDFEFLLEKDYLELKVVEITEKKLVLGSMMGSNSKMELTKSKY